MGDAYAHHAVYPLWRRILVAGVYPTLHPFSPFRPLLVVLPILAAAYCIYVWVRKTDERRSWVGFFAATMCALVLVTLPTMVAAYLPLIESLSRLAGK